jgi:hypothetical protein
MAVRQEFTTTSFTAIDKFIGFMATIIKSTTHMKKELLPSSQEPTQIQPQLMMMTSIIKTQ